MDRPIARLHNETLSAEFVSYLLYKLTKLRVQLLKRFNLVEKPNCTQIGTTSRAPLRGLSWLLRFFCFLLVLSLHVIAFEENASYDLEEHDFVSVFGVYLQKVVVAFELEDEPSHLVQRVD